jgi:hypothetical protein
MRLDQLRIASHAGVCGVKGSDEAHIPPISVWVVPLKSASTRNTTCSPSPVP